MNYVEKIESSEMILVGIGENFDIKDDSLESYNKLAELLCGKNYFVISLSMDDRIYSSNIKEDRIVKPCGGYSFKQCISACTDDLYDVNVSVCPHCGKELVFNNILAENYVEAGYLPMWEKYKLWLTGTLNKKLLVLEFGVGLKFPQIIRWPVERIVMLNNKAELIRINENFWQIPEELSGKAQGINSNPIDWLKTLS